MEPAPLGSIFRRWHNSTIARFVLLLLVIVALALAISWRFMLPEFPTARAAHTRIRLASPSSAEAVEAAPQRVDFCVSK